MIHVWLLRVHRWAALVFALPLAALIVTGLILSFEPIAQDLALHPGSLDAGRLVALLERHDPDRRARALAILPYENRLAIQGDRRSELASVDLSTGEAVTPGSWSGLFRASRRLHEHMIADLDWLVTASTIAMVALIVLGIGMGWPRLRNSLSGWHQAVAWFGLPLLLACPATGLLMALGITFASPLPRNAGAEPMPLIDAVRILGREKDPSRLIWLRMRGGRTMARLDEDGRHRVYLIGRDGLAPIPSNWPRLLHEGNHAGIWPGLLNAAVALGFATLLTTGVPIWSRRRLRRWRRRRSSRPAQA